MRKLRLKFQTIYHVTFEIINSEQFPTGDPKSLFGVFFENQKFSRKNTKNPKYLGQSFARRLQGTPSAAKLGDFQKISFMGYFVYTPLAVSILAIIKFK